MTKRQNKWPFKLILGVVLLLCGLYAFALFTNNTIVFESSKIALIPVVLTLYFTRFKYMANLFFCIFILFFIGDALSVAKTEAIADLLSRVAYLGSYCLLMVVLVSKLKRVKFEGLVSLYLIFVSLLNVYFFYMFYDVIRDNFTTTLNLSFYVMRSAILIAMCFLAFTVYLSSETKQAILFLTMAFCFVFADVLKYISDLYIYYWLFDWIGNALHLVGVFVLFEYVTNHNRKTSPFILQNSMDRLTALGKTNNLHSEITQ